MSHPSTGRTYVAHDLTKLGIGAILTPTDGRLFDPITGELLNEEDDILESAELVKTERAVHTIVSGRIQRNRGYDAQESLLRGGDNDVTLPHMDERFLNFESQRKRVKLGDVVADSPASDNWAPSTTTKVLQGFVQGQALTLQSDYNAMGLTAGPVSSAGSWSAFSTNTTAVRKTPVVSQRRERVVSMPSAPRGPSVDLAKRSSVLDLVMADAEKTEMKQHLERKYEEARDKAQQRRNGSVVVPLSTIEEACSHYPTGKETKGAITTFDLFLERINRDPDSELKAPTAPQPFEDDGQSVTQIRSLEAEERQADPEYLKRLMETGAPDAPVKVEREVNQHVRSSTFAALLSLKEGDFEDVGPAPPPESKNQKRKNQRHNNGKRRE